MRWVIANNLVKANQEAIVVLARQGVDIDIMPMKGRDYRRGRNGDSLGDVEDRWIVPGGFREGVGGTITQKGEGIDREGVKRLTT